MQALFYNVSFKIQLTSDFTKLACFCACVLGHVSRVHLYVTLWTIAHQAPIVHKIPQAGILEWVVISFSRGSYQPRDGTWVSLTAGGFFSN